MGNLTEHLVQNEWTGEVDELFLQTLNFLKAKLPEIDVQFFRHRFEPECYQPLGLSAELKNHLQVLYHFEKENLKKTGEFFQIENDMIFAFFGADQRISYFLFLVNGVHVSTDKLRQICRELKHLYILTAKSAQFQTEQIKRQMVDLISQLTHDLNSIANLLHTSFQTEAPLRESRKYYEKISSEVMLYLRESRIKRSEVSVHELIETIIADMMIPDTIKIELLIEERFDIVNIDVELMEKVVLRIVENAIFASTIQGHEVSIKLNKEMNRSLFMDFDWISLTVRDNGPGIMKDFLDHIKKPFFTTWKQQGHVGLGLSVADKLIREMGGTLKIKSNIGEGTTVKIYIPNDC